MIRVVIDTSVMASGVANRRGVPGLLIDAWRAGRIEVAISPHLVKELEETLSDRYFRKRLSRRKRQRAVALLSRWGILVEPDPSVSGVAPSRKDDLVLGTAVAASAQYLVTRDVALHDLGVYRGVSLISPEAFLELLE